MGVSNSLEDSQASTSSAKTKSTFTALREMIRDFGSPKAAKYSVNQRSYNKYYTKGYKKRQEDLRKSEICEEENSNVEQMVCENEKIEADLTENGTKLYSREKLLKLSRNPACLEKPI